MLACLLGIAFLWLLVVFFMLQLNQQHTIYPDASSYLKAGQLLAQDFTPHHYRPYGMAIYSSLPRIFGPGSQTIFSHIKFINIPVWLLSIALLFLTLQYYTTSKKAFFISLVYVSCVGIVILNTLLLSEIPWIAMMLLGLYGLTKYRFERKQLWLALGISVIILSILIRPISKYIIILLLLIYWKELWLLLKTHLKFILAGSVLLLVFQCGMMSSTYGNFTVSYIDFYTVHHYLTDKASMKDQYIENKNGLATNLSFKDYQELIYSKRDSLHLLITEFQYEGDKKPGRSYSEQQQFAKTQFTQALFKNPTGLFSTYLGNELENLIMPSLYIKNAENINNTAIFESSKTTFYWLSHFQNVGFSILGLCSIILTFVLWLKKKIVFKQDKIILFLAMTLLYTMLVMGISADQYDRLNIPNYAMILILATMVIRRLRKQNATSS